MPRWLIRSSTIKADYAESVLWGLRCVDDVTSLRIISCHDNTGNGIRSGLLLAVLPRGRNSRVGQPSMDHRPGTTPRTADQLPGSHLPTCTSDLCNDGPLWPGLDQWPKTGHTEAVETCGCLNPGGSPRLQFLSPDAPRRAVTSMDPSIGWVGIATAALGAVALLVWLAGLMIALRGTKPQERDAILRAYGKCQPRMAFRRRNRP